MKKQIELFLTALMFYTRIPVPKNLAYSDDALNKSTVYFPLVGWITGIVSAVVYIAFNMVAPKEVAVLMSMSATILLTGAFHEDGFADFCDGFGGGYFSKDKILSIMKDSRIGVYGAIGIIMVLLTKFFLIKNFGTEMIPFLLIAAHASSRVWPVATIFFLNYVRENDTSKIKPIGKKISFKSLVIASIIGFSSFLFFTWQFALMTSLVSFLVFIGFRYYIKRRIGGYTGDCLGAEQQIMEIVFYLCFTVSTVIFGAS